MANIRLEALGAEIARAVEQYTYEVQESIDRAASWSADQLVDILKSTSPDGASAKNKYKNGWKKKRIKSGHYKVYNKNKPGLAHLLEYGHAKRGGGRVEGKPHIRPAEQRVNEVFNDLVVNIVEGGTRVGR